MLSVHIIVALVSYFVFSAAVGAMSEPTDAQQRSFYGWLYRFLQRLAANADRLAEARLATFTGAAGFDGTRGIAVATHEQRDSIAVATGGGK